MENQKQEALSLVSGRLGKIVWWQLPTPFPDFRREEFEAIFQAAGLSRAVPRKPLPKTSLGRAVATIPSRFARKHFRGNQGEDVYAISVVDPEGENRVRYQQIGWFAAAADGSLGYHIDSASGAEDAFLSVVQEYYRSATIVNSTDLSSALAYAMNGRRRAPLLGAVPLRGNTGGVYYVPNQNADALMRLRDALAEKGVCEITTFDLADYPNDRLQVEQSATESFARRTSEIIADLDGLKERASKAGEWDEKLFKSYQERFSALETAAGFYSELSVGLGERLTQKVQAARQEILTAAMNSIGTFAAAS